MLRAMPIDDDNSRDANGSSDVANSGREEDGRDWLYRGAFRAMVQDFSPIW